MLCVILWKMYLLDLSFLILVLHAYNCLISVYSCPPLFPWSKQVAPKIAPFSFGEAALNQGEPASVQCTILGGDLPINVTWLLNGRAIDSFHDISLARLGKRVNVLTVESVAAHHAGNYSCRASNKAGTTEYAAQLIVDGLLMAAIND